MSRIDEIENMSEKSVRSWKNKLISQGYDGVIFGKGTNTEEHVCFDASLRSILRLKTMGRGKSNFYIDYNEGNPDDMIGEEFSSEREFNRAIRQAVTKH